MTRRARRLTQEELGGRVGLGQSEISYLERGFGARTSIETWVAIGIALGRPIAIGFGRDVVEPLRDAGHLAAQELLTRLATAAGWRASFEVPIDPRQPSHAIDVLLERPGGTVLVEIWNRLEDLGAATRSTDRKLAAALGGGPTVRAGTAVASCWLLVDTAANRAIVRAFPAILRARFRGSSAAWVDALVRGAPPPRDAGIAWIDVRGRRLVPLRLARQRGRP